MIPATTGTVSRPVLLSRASTSVAGGKTETTTSGRSRSMSESRPGAPNRVSSHWTNARVGAGAREGPEAEVPEPPKPIEDDARRPLADRRHDTAHGRERVLDDDGRVRSLGPQLLGEPPRGAVMPLAHAGGEDEDPDRHGRHATQRCLRSSRARCCSSDSSSPSQWSTRSILRRCSRRCSTRWAVTRGEMWPRSPPASSSSRPSAGLVLVFGPGRALLHVVSHPSHRTVRLIEAAVGVLLIVVAAILWRTRARVAAEPRPGPAQGRQFGVPDRRGNHGGGAADRAPLLRGLDRGHGRRPQRSGLAWPTCSSTTSCSSLRSSPCSP